MCSHHNLAASNETNSLKVLYCIIENANKTSADFWVHMRFRFIEQYMNSPYGVTMRRERLLGKARDIDLFRHLLQEGIDRRALKDLPLALHFALAFGPILSLLRDHILGFLVLDDVLIRNAVEACWDGVRSQDGPG